MPRSSRRKSHKQHKHGSKDLKEISESEEIEMNSKQLRTETVMELPRNVREGSQGVRVSKDDLFSTGNDGFSGESKRRKVKVDSNRWDGGDDEHGEGLNGDGSNYPGNELKMAIKEEKCSKVSVDLHCNSSRRHENRGVEQVQRIKDGVTVAVIGSEDAKSSSAKVDWRRKLEKELDRNEVHQCRDGKEKKRSGVERDKNVEVKGGMSVDAIEGVTVVISEVSRKQGAQEERMKKEEIEITEWKLKDDLRNPELEKELEKRIRRRDGSDDKHKRPDDARDSNARNLSSRDSRIKNGRYKDERHKDSRYKDKYQGDLDRDHRCQDYKHREERSSRDHTSDRSYNKHLRDEYRSSESRHNRTKLLDSDQDGSLYVDDRNAENNMGRKWLSDDNRDHGELKSRGSKELHVDLVMNASKIDKIIGEGRSESPYLRLDLVDNTVVNNQQKSSPSWHNSKQAESAYRSPLSEEKVHPATGSTGSRELSSGFGVSGKVPGSQLADKPKQKQHHLDGSSSENAAVAQNERSPRLAGQTSPPLLAGNSPPSTQEHRNSSKISRRQSLDSEERSRRSSSFKDGNESRRRESPWQKRMGDEFSQPEARNADMLPISSSSFNRSGQYSGTSSNLHPPLPPFRLGINAPSVFGSSEDELRVQTGDSMFNNRYKRGNDPMGRGQGNSWNGIPNWPLPVPNGFIPFQPGHAATGFHALVPQFLAPPMFGVRPSMELNPGPVPYHMHEGDRFSDGHTFGWRGPADDPLQPYGPAHFHGWEGSDGIFGDESHIYGRSDWDQHRYMMGTREWDMSADLWKGQNGSMHMELPASQRELDHPACVQRPDEAWAGQPGHQPRHEQIHTERSEGIEIKRSEDAPLVKTKVEVPRRNADQKAPERAKISNTTTSWYYISKLDISMDLAGPGLYNQCTSLLGLDGSPASNCRESSGKMFSESFPKDTEIAAGSSNHGLKAASFFPKVTDTIFERAMALYEKQRESMKVNLRALKNHEKASPTLEREKATLQAIGSPADNGKNHEVSQALEREKATSQAIDYLGDNGNGSGGSGCDGSGQRISQLGAVSGPLILADGTSGPCEALRPESIGCRVNLSRIHNSQESTH